jgi:nucleoside-triphosphatase THEP1
LKNKLSNIWLKASVLGCLWASSEIVLGSFLHNLRIPFSGNILTAIGIVIMISMGQVWPERGLFWRTGLVCALMKSISPSAIIFGPMLGIFMEALLLELSTFVFRKSIIAFLVGGALAMSWNLAQVLLGYVITYGPDIIRLYESLTIFFHKQLGISSGDYWWPIKIILIFYVAGGLLSAAIGLYVGRTARYREEKLFSGETKNTIPKLRSQGEASGNFSVWLLLVNIVLMVAALVVFNMRNLLISSSTVIVISIFWIIRYPKVLRPLRKPGFWIFLVLTTTLSAYLLTSFSSGKNDGWIIGLEMNLRAIVMILGFAVIGRELRNPIISNWLQKAGFRQLPGALELAFESLPAVIAYLPSWKDIIKNPFSTFSSYIHLGDQLLKMHNSKLRDDERIMILTGDRGQGKSTFLSEIIQQLKTKEINVGGFIAKAVMDNGERAGFNLVNAETGETTTLARMTGIAGMEMAGKYYLSKEGLEAGKIILSSEEADKKDLIIVDEIGFIELEGRGWAESVNRLVNETSCNMLWVVRKDILNDVITKWNLKNPVILDVSQTTVVAATSVILKALSK